MICSLWWLSSQRQRGRNAELDWCSMHLAEYGVFQHLIFTLLFQISDIPNSKGSIRMHAWSLHKNSNTVSWQSKSMWRVKSVSEHPLLSWKQFKRKSPLDLPWPEFLYVLQPHSKELFNKGMWVCFLNQWCVNYFFSSSGIINQNQTFKAKTGWSLPCKATSLL